MHPREILYLKIQRSTRVADVLQVENDAAGRHPREPLLHKEEHLTRVHELEHHVMLQMPIRPLEIHSRINSRVNSKFSLRVNSRLSSRVHWRAGRTHTHKQAHAHTHALQVQGSARPQGLLRTTLLYPTYWNAPFTQLIHQTHQWP